MQVASRTNRRYVTPTMKGKSGIIHLMNIKPSDVPSISHSSSPKKILDSSENKSNESLTLQKLVNCFHDDKSRIEPEHDSINSDFWWLHDELKNTSCSGDNEHKSNFPEIIQVFPSIDIDQDLNKRASLLLNQTFSDIGQISSTGVGSTMTITTPITNIVHEQPARSIFTRIVDSEIEDKTENNEDDILYKWRLRHRLGQA